MFRSALDALDVLASMEQQGIALHMLDLGGDVTGNGISKLVFTILSAVAEAERNRIRERVSTTKADQRERGRYLGGKVPFGYRVAKEEKGGALVEVPEEQAGSARMRIMRTAGSVTTRHDGGDAGIGAPAFARNCQGSSHAIMISTAAS